MDGHKAARAVMICGAGHSGSTLLGMILGGHSQTFYMGEGGKARYLGDASKPERKRVCKICGEHCPVWSDFRWDQSEPLYAKVGAHTGRPVIIDSTKDERWINARADEVRRDGGVPALIFLTRDGRAVINSRIRKYPDRDAATQIDDWVAKMDRSASLFESFDGPKMIVRYEDLSVDTEATVRAVCDLLGLEFEPEMLRFAEHEHHVLGGNSGTQWVAARTRLGDGERAFVSLTDRTRGYYENHSGKIELDLRWKSEMAPADLQLFEDRAGRANAMFKWGQ